MRLGNYQGMKVYPFSNETKFPDIHSNKECCCGGHNSSNAKSNLHHHSTKKRFHYRQLKKFIAYMKGKLT